MATLPEMRPELVTLAATSAKMPNPPPEIVPLRHPTFAPNVSGSFTDDVHAARARISAEPV